MLQNFLLLLLCGEVLTDPINLWPPENRMPDPNDAVPVGEFIPEKTDRNNGGESLEIPDGRVTSSGFILAVTPPSSSFQSSSPDSLRRSPAEESLGSGRKSLEKYYFSPIISEVFALFSALFLISLQMTTT